MSKIMIQSGDNFAHVMTAELSWHVQICELIRSSESKLKYIEFLQDFYYKHIYPIDMKYV